MVSGTDYVDELVAQVRPIVQKWLERVVAREVEGALRPVRELVRQAAPVTPPATRRRKPGPPKRSSLEVVQVIQRHHPDPVSVADVVKELRTAGMTAAQIEARDSLLYKAVRRLRANGTIDQLPDGRLTLPGSSSSGGKGSQGG